MHVALKRPVSKKKTTRAPNGLIQLAIGQACVSARLWELRDRKTELAGNVGVLSRCKIRFVLNNTKTVFFPLTEKNM